MNTQSHLPPHIAVVGIVDDDPAVRNSLKFSLEIDGFAVEVYASGDELLSADDLSHFRCLVVDQNMPGMNGLDLVAELRNRQYSMPVILITSHPPRALAASAIKLGVPIIEKPLLGSALQDKIHDMVAHQAPPG